MLNQVRNQGFTNCRHWIHWKLKTNHEQDVELNGLSEGKSNCGTMTTEGSRSSQCEHQSTKVQNHQSTKVPKHKNKKITEVQKYTRTEIKKV